MKNRILTGFILFTFSFCTFAQTGYDALRLGQTDIVGTARYMSMGGAFGALGGDASALKDNPAGLGVYRTGEISITLNGMGQSSTADWYNESRSASSAVGFKFNQFAYIMSIPLWQNKTSGLLMSNFSFGYNRVKNFNRVMTASGNTDASFTDFVAAFSNGLSETDLKYTDSYEPYDNPNIPWLSILAYDSYLMENGNSSSSWVSAFQGNAKSRNTIYESGGIGEYQFGWGGNFNNNLFIGANLNFIDLSYRMESVLTEDFSTGGFDLTNTLSQSGMGVNLKLGVIYLPLNYLRLGASIHTPTAYTITENAYASIAYSNQNYSANGKANVPSAGSRQNFDLSSPFQAQLSAAYLFGRSGLISFEYNFINYPGMSFSETNGNKMSFEPENESIKEMFNNGHVFKFGAEFKPLDKLALRAGFAHSTGAIDMSYTQGKALRLNTVNTNTEYFEHLSTSYAGIGIGYRQPGWFLDLSYGIKILSEDFYPYQTLWYNYGGIDALKPTPASVKTNSNNITLTLGLKI